MDLPDILMVGTAALVLSICWCLYRFVTLLTGWHVAVANVWRGGYSELERFDDFSRFGFTPGSLRGWNIRDDEGMRWIEDEVVFETAEGEKVRAIVGRQVRRSRRPDSVYRLWYDRADPRRVTVHGPGQWLLLAFVLTTFLAGIFAWGIEWAQTGQPPQWAISHK
ncbi:MAG: hypothetical protein NTX28_14625 [Novosphingobium sp.]|nr:hypothetical protein [Novosphingobium sp.]